MRVHKLCAYIGQIAQRIASTYRMVYHTSVWRCEQMRIMPLQLDCSGRKEKVQNFHLGWQIAWHVARCAREFVFVYPTNRHVCALGITFRARTRRMRQLCDVC